MLLKHFYIVFLFPFWCISQQTEIISLHENYSTYQNKDLAKALKYAKRAYNLNEENISDSLAMVSCHNYIEVLLKLRRVEDAKTLNKELINFAKKVNNNKYIALSYIYASDINRINRNYKESLSDIEKALSITRNNNLDNTTLHKALNSKAFLYESTENRSKLFSLLNNIINNTNFNNSNELALTYNYMGNLYFPHLKKKDSSAYYYKKGINLLKETDDNYLKTILYTNYGDLLLQTDNWKEGLAYLNLAEETAIESNNLRFLYNIISSIGIHYHLNEEYPKAIQKYNEAEKNYGKQARKQSIAHLYWMLSEAYYLNNQPKEAYLTQEKLLYLRDSLFTIEKNKTFEKLQTEYEVEKKNNQISFLEKEKKLEAKRKKLVFSIGGLLVFILGLLVFVYRYRVRSQKLILKQEQKLHEQEKKQLQQAQEIQRIEGFIQGEEKEKNRIAMELHDGIGGQLSGIKHYIASLPKNDETAVILKNVGSVSQEVRLLSHSLSTNFSLHQPFSNLLQTLKQQYKNHFEIEFMIFPEKEIDKIPKELKLFLHRSIQELLNNIYKYAHANFVSVNLTITTEIVLIVEDNGKGFSTFVTPKGIGLQNIQDKVTTLNGFFEIDSFIEKGTTVILKLPR